MTLLRLRESSKISWRKCLQLVALAFLLGLFEHAACRRNSRSRRASISAHKQEEHDETDVVENEIDEHQNAFGSSPVLKPKAFLEADLTPQAPPKPLAMLKQPYIWGRVLPKPVSAYTAEEEHDGHGAFTGPDSAYGWVEQRFFEPPLSKTEAWLPVRTPSASGEKLELIGRTHFLWREDLSPPPVTMLLPEGTKLRLLLPDLRHETVEIIRYMGDTSSAKSLDYEVKLPNGERLVTPINDDTYRPGSDADEPKTGKDEGSSTSSSCCSTQFSFTQSACAWHPHAII
ncbi:unnamed protein product [Amoebophrya sp. A25]|nr:unnamed protein product [Amoebophrya sp. A25]|eukprot:GSA25T00005787001.1